MGSAASGSGPRGATAAADGVQAAESQAACSDLGRRPVPMALLLAALITNRVPDRCWRPGLRSSCLGLRVSHFPVPVCCRLTHPGARPLTPARSHR